MDDQKSVKIIENLESDETINKKAYKLIENFINNQKMYHYIDLSIKLCQSNFVNQIMSIK